MHMSMTIPLMLFPWMIHNSSVISIHDHVWYNQLFWNTHMHVQIWMYMWCMESLIIKYMYIYEIFSYIQCALWLMIGMYIDILISTYDMKSYPRSPFSVCDMYSISFSCCHMTTHSGNYYHMWDTTGILYV